MESNFWRNCKPNHLNANIYTNPWFTPFLREWSKICLYLVGANTERNYSYEQKTEKRKKEIVPIERYKRALRVQGQFSVTQQKDVLYVSWRVKGKGKATKCPSINFFFLKKRVLECCYCLSFEKEKKKSFGTCCWETQKHAPRTN